LQYQLGLICSLQKQRLEKNGASILSPVSDTSVGESEDFLPSKRTRRGLKSKLIIDDKDDDDDCGGGHNHDDADDDNDDDIVEDDDDDDDYDDENDQDGVGDDCEEQEKRPSGRKCKNGKKQREGGTRRQKQKELDEIQKEENENGKGKKRRKNAVQMNRKKQKQSDEVQPDRLNPIFVAKELGESMDLVLDCFVIDCVAPPTRTKAKDTQPQRLKVS